MEDSRAHVLIYGRVQGVFFRHETRQVAETLGLRGWVRNNYDGTVEAVFEGERDKVERAIEWSRRGPRRADVDRVEVEWEEVQGEGSFGITY